MKHEHTSNCLINYVLPRCDMNKTKQTNAFCGVIPSSLNIELAVREFDRHLARLAYHLQKMILLVKILFACVTRAKTKVTFHWQFATFTATEILNISIKGFFPFLKKRKNQLQLFSRKVIKHAKGCFFTARLFARNVDNDKSSEGDWRPRQLDSFFL